MADIVKINKNIQYQAKCVVYGLLAGETRTLEFINENFASHIIDAYLKDGTFELFPSNELKQEVPLVENTPIDTQTPQEEVVTNPAEIEIETPTFEIMYKTTQSIQDKDGNEIEVGSQFTESELKEIIAQDKRQSRKKIKDLLEEEKLMETKSFKTEK